MNLFNSKKITCLILSVTLMVQLLGLVIEPVLAQSQDIFLEENSSTGELLVKLKSSDKIYKVKNLGFNVEDLQQTALKNPEIEYAEPNYIFQAAFLPNDIHYSEQWYLDKVKAPQSWDLAQGGSADIVIAILDTGVDIAHPDLKDNIWTNYDEKEADLIDNDHNGYVDDRHGWDFVRRISNPKPKFDEEYNESGIHHGTLVAGIAASVGNNNEGTIGAAWQSKIMPLRVLNSHGTGSLDHVIQGVKYAIDNGAKIINLSFVGTNKSYFLTEALKEAWNKGLLIVAAAGNETSGSPSNLNNNPTYPVCLDEDDENYIIGVTAVDDNDRKARFSNYGSHCVDISAPGTRIYGPLVYNPNREGFRDYYGGYWSGTSIAAPIISGLAALIWSTNPLLTQRQVQAFILGQADNINPLNPNYQGELGSGRVNFYKSVEYALNQLTGLPQSHYIITGAGPGGGPHVRVFDYSGSSISSFFAYHPKFSGGVNVASGDLDGDGVDEIITGAGPGGGPHVRVFDLYANPKGGFFAYEDDFRGGVNVASGDLDGDGVDEIIIGPEKNKEPLIKIFRPNGKLIREFYAYHPKFSGGVNVASGDLDGDGVDEIITGAGPGGGPHVRVFDGFGNIKFHFFAFNRNFLGGVRVAVGDIDGNNNGRQEIIASVASGAAPYVRVFDSEFLLLRFQFLAYQRDYYQGVKIIVADFDGDQRAEIITGPGKEHNPETRIYNSNGDILSQFYAYVRHFWGGVNIAVMETSGY